VHIFDNPPCPVDFWHRKNASLPPAKCNKQKFKSNFPLLQAFIEFFTSCLAKPMMASEEKKCHSSIQMHHQNSIACGGCHYWKETNSDKIAFKLRISSLKQSFNVCLAKSSRVKIRNQQICVAHAQLSNIPN